MSKENADHRDQLIRSLYDMIEELRPPLANLRAAAENLSTHPDLSPVMRSAFENIILQESTILANAFSALSEISGRAIQSTRAHTVLSCSSLFDSLRKRINSHHGGKIHTMGSTCSLSADRETLLLLLEFFINRIMEKRDTVSISCEVSPEKKYIYIDLIWQGAPFTATELESWQAERLTGDGDHHTVGGVLKEHDSAVWSNTLPENNSSMLRIPLPAPARTDPEQ